MPTPPRNEQESNCLVYITTTNDTEAKLIASQLLTEKLAACANLLGEIHSMYWWNGEIQQEPEYALLLKTRKDLFQLLKDRICELHSYECPCIIALPIEQGNPEFLSWISEQTCEDNLPQD